jgi:alpha-mannosidase
LNDPIFIRRVTGGVGGEVSRSLVNVDKQNTIIETVKQAEDGNGMIVRLFENERCRGPVRLQVDFPITDAYCCNLLEENEEQLDINQNEVQLDLKPYQIVTLRLVPGAEAQ